MGVHFCSGYSFSFSNNLSILLFQKIPDPFRLKAAVQIAIPGMILDIFSVIYYNKVFPNLSIETLPIFSAWLLWAYSFILISGFPLKGKNK
ncbi:DUF5367 family protein [Neobacillus sp. LXY-1]|uniref:DUF5367 family protein n=1 Tax=Neobacillus sp. LXY-1 TaxID=3379133 RepID=UPI003EE2787A